MIVARQQANQDAIMDSACECELFPKSAAA
jgi:hypothetical protein